MTKDGTDQDPLPSCLGFLTRRKLGVHLRPDQPFRMSFKLWFTICRLVVLVLLGPMAGFYCPWGLSCLYRPRGVSCLYRPRCMSCYRAPFTLCVEEGIATCGCHFVSVLLMVGLFYYDSMPILFSLSIHARHAILVVSSTWWFILVMHRSCLLCSGLLFMHYLLISTSCLISCYDLPVLYSRLLQTCYYDSFKHLSSCRT